MSPSGSLEETLIRSGLRPCGGNLTSGSRSARDSGAPRDNEAWANNHVGLFIFDKAKGDVVDVDITVLRDVVACGVVLNDTTTSLVVGRNSFQAESCGMTTIYLPRGERFHYATCSQQGLRSVTMVLDLDSFVHAYGVDPRHLPESLRNLMGNREGAAEQVRPSSLVKRVVDDLGSRRGMFPTIPSLYLEGKACEFISAWLWQLKQRDQPEISDRKLDIRTRERVARIKCVIDRKAQFPLNVDALAREAAMNRTKLRSAFREIYGITMSAYVISLVMRRAADFLREPGATVVEAARVSGYSNPSSFIVAYIRFFGISPGRTLRSVKQ